MKRTRKVDAAIVRQRLDYDSETGALTHRERHGRRAVIGAAAGYVHASGYRVVGIEKRQYYAHQLAWAHHYGEWPEMELDHVNGDRADNRLENLRECTQSQNAMNRSVQRNNRSTGHKGVYPITGSSKYQVVVAANGESHRVGCFASIPEAVEARRAAAERLHGEYARQ